MKKSLIALAIGAAVILLAAAGYLIFQNQKLITRLSQTSPSPSPSPSPQENIQKVQESPQLTPSPKTMTLSELQENIEASVNSKNTQAMATYMTNPVSVILQATECCGEQTPDEAVAQLSYVEPGIPFNFDQKNETIKNLKSKNPELAGTFVAISQNMEYLVAFTVNNQNKITQVRFAVSWKLFTY